VRSAERQGETAESAESAEEGRNAGSQERRQKARSQPL
jgi:hypothetical protein